MRICFLLLLVFFSTAISGQTVYSGQVLSLTDSTPIAGFAIRINNSSIIRTDSTGSFSIQSGKQRLRVSSLFPLHGFDTTVKSGSPVRLYAAKAYDAELAKYDIQQGTLQLFCGVSYAPAALMEADLDFQRKYQVHYYITGDFIPSSVSALSAYNKVAAEYLDKAYGRSWRKEMRKDVVGIGKE